MSKPLPSEVHYQEVLAELQILNDIADALCEASHELMISAEALIEVAPEALQSKDA